MLALIVMAAGSVADAPSQSHSLPNTSALPTFSMGSDGPRIIAEATEPELSNTARCDTVSATFRCGPTLLDTLSASLFGKPDPDAWRPLYLSTFLSDGWNEAWVPAPKGSGGAPRQSWINGATGFLSRANFFTFAQGFN